MTGIPGDPDEFIYVTRFTRELEELTGEPVRFSTRKIYQLMVDNRLPGDQLNGRWGAWRRKLPDVARALGLRVPRSSTA